MTEVSPEHLEVWRDAIRPDHRPLPVAETTAFEAALDAAALAYARPGLPTTQHETLTVAMTAGLHAFARHLEAEADGMSENWTRARGIADGLRRAARRARGE